MDAEHAADDFIEQRQRISGKGRRVAGVKVDPQAYSAVQRTISMKIFGGWEKSVQVQAPGLA